MSSGTEVQAEKLVETFERIQEEDLAKSSQEIKLDDTNKVSFPGYPYTFEALNEKILVSIDIFKSGYECKVCQGKKTVEIKQGRETVQETCSACKGIGASLILPDTSKKLPTHGVVVSMGRIAREKADFKVGDRVLFGEYTGTMLPTKAGLMFKYLDWYGGVIKIEGANELAAFDFIITADSSD
jgi:co-chaperonin GroES (HSP10)